MYMCLSVCLCVRVHFGICTRRDASRWAHTGHYSITHAGRDSLLTFKRYATVRACCFLCVYVCVCVRIQFGICTRCRVRAVGDSPCACACSCCMCTCAAFRVPFCHVINGCCFQENYVINGLTPQPMLTTALHLSMSTLKTS